MTPDTEIRDATLIAYLDGKLSRAEADMVADAVVDSPPLAARLAELEQRHCDQGPDFDMMLAAMPQRLQASAVAARADGIGRGWLLLPAAMVLAVGIALGLHVSHFGDPVQDWHSAVAAAQRLQGEEAMALGQTTQQGQAKRAQVADALGRDLESLIQTPRLMLNGAQILTFDGAPLARLAFQGEAGERVGLWILRKNERAALNAGQINGMQAASWSDGRFAYLLIGGQDAALIAQVAAHLQGR